MKPPPMANIPPADYGLPGRFLVELLENLIALESGEATTGQVATLCHLDIIDVREAAAKAIARFRARWEDHRKRNPPRMPNDRDNRKGPG